MRTRKSEPMNTVDWDERKARLAEARAALEATERLSAAQAKTVMDERARLLAKTPEKAPDTSEILEVITFRLGQEKFGIETQYVHEVNRPGDLTPLPGGPRFLVGLTNLRGGVLAVMDLREFFGVSVTADSSRPQVVIIGNDQPDLGLRVDEVFEVETVRIDDLLIPPSALSDVARNCLRGVTRDALLVLDGEAVLAEERLYVDEGGERGAGLRIS